MERLDQAEVRVILAPVRWSDIDRRVRRHQDAIVDEYLRVRGAPLLEEDGEPLLHGNGRHQVVTQANFAERYKVPGSTFREWLRNRGETNPTEAHYAAAREISAGTQRSSPPAGAPVARRRGGRLEPLDAATRRWDEEVAVPLGAFHVALVALAREARRYIESGVYWETPPDWAAEEVLAYAGGAPPRGHGA